MKEFRDNQLSARLSRAATSKQQMLARSKLPDANDPAVIQRKAEREAIALAKAERAAAKAQAALERAAREAAEQIEREAEAKRAALAIADQEVAAAAERKLARDARYAARKMRKA
jgi:hypothetical protein